LDVVGWEDFFALSMLFAASDKKPWVAKSHGGSRDRFR
jgi:hypothetical protein